MRKQNSLKFLGKRDFHNYIKDAVERYFRRYNLKPRDNPRYYFKAAVCLLWLGSSYVFLVLIATNWWQAGLSMVSLGLSMAAVGFCIQHDGGHGAVSRYPWVNRWMARGLDLTGGSSYLWKYKHNGFHHNYSNIQDHDDDIEAGFLARLGPEQPRYWFHRYQHIYLWFIYGFVVIKWHIIDDFMNVWNAKIGQHTIKRPRGTELVVFIGGKVLFFILAFIIPSLVHPIWHVILFYLVTCWFMGTLIAIVFQLAHVVEEAEFPKPDAVTGNMTTGWAQHQVSTTMDFACQNRLLTWYLGGLNFQVVHHVLPTISHIHYPRVARIVKKACKKFNVKYNVQHTLFGAIRSHYRHLKKMGQPIPVS